MVRRVEIVGALASGKTALLDLLDGLSAAEDDIVMVREDLTAIGSHRACWARQRAEKSFLLQCAYYRTRWEQTQCALKQQPNARWVVSDFSLVGDHRIYSAHFRDLDLLTDLEFAELGWLNRFLQAQLPPLAGIIYRRCGADTIARRMRVRGRSDDSQISAQSVARLVTLCEAFVAEAEVPVLVLDQELQEICASELQVLFSQFLRELG